MIKSERIFSPQSYLEAVTGKCYITTGEDDIAFIHDVLAENGYDDDLWDYPLVEIDHVVENELDVVLVDCMAVNPKTDNFEHVYRWFEVPGDFVDEDDVDEDVEVSVDLSFEEFVQKLENGAKTFEEVYTGMGLEVVECIGNTVYDDQDLYDFLESLGATISDYGAGYVVIETDAGRTYEVPYENRPNRFDPEYTEETVIFFDGKSIYDITESEEE